jgi:hypothetical protein
MKALNILMVDMKAVTLVMAVALKVIKANSLNLSLAEANIAKVAVAAIAVTHAKA